MAVETSVVRGKVDVFLVVLLIPVFGLDDEALPAAEVVLRRMF
jgi:hypothetical protein